MTAPNIVAKWAGWAPQLRSALRIVAAFMFILAGTVKLFAFPIGMPPNGSTAPLLSEFWFAGVLETFEIGRAHVNSSHGYISYAVFCLKKKKHTSELQSRLHLVCRLLLEKKKKHYKKLETDR